MEGIHNTEYYVQCHQQTGITEVVLLAWSWGLFLASLLDQLTVIPLNPEVSDYLYQYIKQFMEYNILFLQFRLYIKNV